MAVNEISPIAKWLIWRTCRSLQTDRKQQQNVGKPSDFSSTKAFELLFSANRVECDEGGCYATLVRSLLPTKIAFTAALMTFANSAALSEECDISGSKIYYEESGAGSAIILLHDGLLDSASWDEVWRPLARKYHVIRYDRRGYGRSDPATSPFSPAEDLAKLLRHLKVEHALVAGSSSGGALAIDFAIKHPKMVDGLFLIGPVLHGMEYSAEFQTRANRNNEPMKRDDVRAMARNWSQDRFLIAGANEKARQKVYEGLLANADKLEKYDSGPEEKLLPPASNRRA